MTNLLIISIYDSGYEMSIWYDNKFYNKDTNNKLMKRIMSEYWNKRYINAPYSSFEKYLKTLDFDTIFVCENGDIERIK